MDDRYVHLAYLGVGQTFGEMSMIDDKPRSATVKAVEDTLVREIHRDNFFDTLRKEPTALLDLLKVLFERLRETQNLILQLQKANPQSVLVPMSEPATVPAQPHTAV